jgi:hypothetical protein
MSLDPHDAALWTISAICLVLVGAVLTPGSVGLNERGAILAAIAGLLLAVGWRIRRRNGGD